PRGFFRCATVVRSVKELGIKPRVRLHTALGNTDEDEVHLAASKPGGRTRDSSARILLCIDDPGARRVDPTPRFHHHPRGVTMSTESKPSVVFCHGIWADGSCFSKVIPPLPADGYGVIPCQYGLDSAQGDVDTVIRTLGRVSSPSILVGHSYGGAVITAAGTDDR